MVTEYKQNSEQCGYRYDKLKDHIYILPSSHTKGIHIDNGDAYIDELAQQPMLIEGFNITFNEESSLDERYKFQKRLEISMNGYVNSSLFDDKYYIILESMDGTLWFINPDFPTKLTYDFQLNDSVYQTTFTFTLTSNYPTLRLIKELSGTTLQCNGYNVTGIESLHLLEKDYSTIDTIQKVVYSTVKAYQEIQFNKNSCSLEETFDGDKATTTITFNIGFDAYKSSWHYNLLEFVQNLYTAVIRPKNGSNAFYAGFKFGLQPSFVVQTNGEESDIITITLTEAADFVAADDYELSADTNTKWNYITNVGEIITWECVRKGKARFLIQQEVNAVGTPTGRYKVKNGYQSHFPTLNIIGTFDDDVQFTNEACEGLPCAIYTDMPPTIVYTEQGCKTYSLSADCDWNIEEVEKSLLTISPTTGVAGQLYQIEICYPQFVSHDDATSIKISTDESYLFRGVLIDDGNTLKSNVRYIDCNKQIVRFNFDPTCKIRVPYIEQNLFYEIGDGYLDITVPKNESIESARTFTFRIINCNNQIETGMIYQNMMYEDWVLTDGYICDMGDSYEKLIRLTGSTLDDISYPTGEEKEGELIFLQDERCQQNSRWFPDEGYICIDGDKYSIETFEHDFDATDWNITDIQRYGQLIESGSTDCGDVHPIYQWRLSNEWQCGLGNKITFHMPNESVIDVPCNDNSTLLKADVRGTYSGETPWSSATSIDVGFCVNQIGTYAFESVLPCSAITIPNSVTNINDYAFSWCYNLSSMVIPSSVTNIGFRAFYMCSGITSVTIQNSVTNIGHGAFGNCYSLRNVDLGNYITSIGNSAFGSCSGLTSITIPNSVTSIGDYVFAECYNLTNVVLSNSLTSIGSGAFGNCSSLTGITIPNSVTSIGDYAFNICYSLTNITIPSSVTSIGQSAFYACENLQSITVEATTPPSLGSGVFDSTNNCPIYVPTASVNAYKSASGWSTYSSRIQAIGS